MAYVSYEARRSLAVGHFAGSEYVLALTITELQRPGSGDLKVMTQTLAGNTETLFFGEQRTWSVTLAPVQIRDAGIHFEFLRSTADGQVFTFDPYGTHGSNVLTLSVIRADSGYTDTVFQREGRGGYTDWVTLGFQVREV